VWDKEFLNESVEVDGKDFNHCTFYNVQLVYRGRKYTSLRNNHFIGTVAVRAEDVAISSYGELLYGLGMLNANEAREDSNHFFIVARAFTDLPQNPQNSPQK
jgi:hypothetical protein